MSVKELETELNDWKTELQLIEDNCDKNRRKSQQILKRKKESIQKLKLKMKNHKEEPELSKLLSGMVKEFDSRCDLSLQQDRINFEQILKHEHRFYQIILNWFNPLKQELCKMMNQLSFDIDTFDVTISENDIIELDPVNKCERLGKSPDPELGEKRDKSVIINDNYKLTSAAAKNVSFQQQPNVRFEDDYERCQSPYTVSLSPKLGKSYVSKVR